MNCLLKINKFNITYTKRKVSSKNVIAHGFMKTAKYLNPNF